MTAEEYRNYLEQDFSDVDISRVANGTFAQEPEIAPRSHGK